MTTIDRRGISVTEVIPATAMQLLDDIVAIKAPVRVATTANINLNGLQTIDGVLVVADDRVLVKDQTTHANNGIYIASAGTWSRAIDFDGADEVVKGTLIYINDGNVNGGKSSYVTSDDPIIPGTSSL